MKRLMLTIMLLVPSPAAALDDAIPARLAVLLNCDQVNQDYAHTYAFYLGLAELLRDAGFDTGLRRNWDILTPSKLDEFVAGADLTIDEIDRRVTACMETKKQREAAITDAWARVGPRYEQLLAKLRSAGGVRKPGRGR